MKLVKDKAPQKRGVSFLNPATKPLPLRARPASAPSSSARPKTPTCSPTRIRATAKGFPQDTHGFSFARAAHRAAERPRRRRSAATSPSPLESALRRATDPFFVEHYGKAAPARRRRDRVEVADNAPWRRIDNEWLYSAETLALKLNTGINNTSLVVAFELPTSGRSCSSPPTPSAATGSRGRT